MERKISNLEKAVAENEDRIKKLKDKLDNVEVESKKSEDDLKHLALQTVGAVSEIIVKKATEAVVEIVSKHQHESVKRNEAALEALCSQLKVLSSSLQSTPLSTLNSPFQPISTTSIPSSSASQPTSVQPSPFSKVQPTSAEPSPSSVQPTSASQVRSNSNQCDICGKSFGSQRALANHTRSDHKPNS